MGTQGLVTITKNGAVLFKAIAGCNGFNADKLVEMIKATPPVADTQVWRMAHDCKFGCKDCLIVIGKESTLGNDVSNIPQRYYTTFADPQFNPRWEQGTAAYTEVVELEAATNA